MKESKTIQAVPGSGVVWQAFRAAAPQTVPVFAGYLVLGMGYGIYVQSLGLPVWMPMLMGTVVYGGSLEFVLASLLLGTFSPLSAFLMALMIQARHLFYGLAMLERYKEIGILRAIGASKHNVSQVFNAETFIIGLCSGVMGVVLCLLLLIPGNMLIHHIAGDVNVVASLPPQAALILIVLATLLTMLGGVIPARSAAKSNPVKALRSE